MELLTPSALGDEIRYWRIYAGMTQEEFARLVEVTPVSVAHWENGKSVPHQKRIHQLADAVLLCRGADDREPLSSDDLTYRIEFVNSCIHLIASRMGTRNAVR